LTLFLLVRHAAHDNVGSYLAGRMAGVHLGEAGRAQAERLGRHLAREAMDEIHSSPRERTRETAAAIAAHHQLDVREAGALDEIDFGAWAGRSFDDLEQDEHWRRWNAARQVTRTPAGESMLDVQVRMVAFAAAIHARLPQGTAVLVSHADPIRALLAYHLGLSADSVQRFDISPASVSRLVIEPWRSLVVSINEPAPEARS
jgi:broad specificity phosphatase PhoE